MNKDLKIITLFIILITAIFGLAGSEVKGIEVRTSQQTQLVMYREAHRPSHDAETPPAEPCSGRLEQSRGNFVVVRALEESEKAHTVPIHL